MATTIPFRSFPVIKYSWAIMLHDTEGKFLWEHMIKSQMAVMLQKDNFGFSSSQPAPGLVMRVLHGNKILVRNIVCTTRSS